MTISASYEFDCNLYRLYPIPQLKTAYQSALNRMTANPREAIAVSAMLAVASERGVIL
jgi:hypothetical protein